MASCSRFFSIGQAMQRNASGHARRSRLWKLAAWHLAILKPIDLAIARSCTMASVRCFTARLRAPWRLSIFWCSGPRNFTGWRSPGSRSASRASIRASLTSFFVFDSVIILRRQGLATYVLNPSSWATSFIHRQCVPVSNATGVDLSCVERNFASPSFVVGIAISMTILGDFPSLAMTQTCVFRSPTSNPIAVLYALFILILLFFCVFARPPWPMRTNHIVSYRRIFCIGGKTCEHANARAALHDASARVDMFASRILSSQLSKNASFPTVGKRLVLHYTSA